MAGGVDPVIDPEFRVCQVEGGFFRGKVEKHLAVVAGTEDNVNGESLFSDSADDGRCDGVQRLLVELIFEQCFQMGDDMPAGSRNNAVGVNIQFRVGGGDMNCKFTPTALLRE